MWRDESSECDKPQVQAWFQEFVPHLRFRRATEGLEPRSAETLVLVRAMMPSMRPGVAVPPPRDSDWVRQDVERKRRQRPTSINVILSRPSRGGGGGQEKDGSPSDTDLPCSCLEYYRTGTEWSTNTADPECAGSRPTRAGASHAGRTKFQPVGDILCLGTSIPPQRLRAGCCRLLQWLNARTSEGCRLL